MFNYIHHYCALALDVCHREPKMIWRYYRPFKLFRGKGESSKYIFMVDDKVTHGGMFDCLKGIISIYAISKELHKDFRIHFVSPFELSDYLMPNEYDWDISDEDITYNYNVSMPIIAFGEYADPHRLLKNRRNECHFYYGYDSLNEINAHFHSNYMWNGLYAELFKPTEYLQKHIDFYRNDIGRDYIVTHFRFLNLLGDKTETDINPTLGVDAKEALKKKCKDKILEIADKHEGKRIMLSTDSNVFMEYIKEKVPDVYTIPGKIKHIGTSCDTSDAEILKMFLDYYIIGGAEKVYSICGPGMWKSAFPEYAAMIGGCRFERLSL